MMDNKKRWGIFIIGTAFIILVAMALFVYFLNRKSTEEPSSNVDVSNVEDADKLMLEAQKNKNFNYTFDPQVEKQRPLDADDIKQMALAFVERFGSYSNQSNYDNIRDLEIFMTAEMRRWSVGYIAELERRNTDYTNYYGITTVAIAGEVKSFDDQSGTAEVIVSTQRREVKGSENTPQIYDQNIRLLFVKEDKSWKVDGAFWVK